MIITLCGSSRFEPLYHALNKALTISGRHTVLSLVAFPSQESTREWYTDAEKRALDTAHLAKIAISDAIVVINRHAYLGLSTLREIDFAQHMGKKLFALESWGEGCGVGSLHNARTRMDVKLWKIPEGFGSPIDTCAPRFHGGWYDLPGEAGPLRSKVVDFVESAKWLAPDPKETGEF